MVFSSINFLLIFFPVFFTCYYLTPNKYKNYTLLLGSLAFYFIGTINAPYHFVLLIACMLVDFVVGLGISRSKKHKKLLLVVGIVFHLICLCTFKYAGFVISELNRLSESFNFTANIILPIGISFYTFQGISYLIDVYRGDIEAEESLLCYCVYISMFEQLIAGPIVTYGQVQYDLHKRNIWFEDALKGLGIFIFGLGLKVLLANPLGKLWAQALAIGFESVSTPLAWMSIAAYSFQLYFDFFGYSLMAIGMGKMLGFELPINFNHPYTSLTMTEFWRRWHITLGSWFQRVCLHSPRWQQKERPESYPQSAHCLAANGHMARSGIQLYTLGFYAFLYIGHRKVLHWQVFECTPAYRTYIYDTAYPIELGFVRSHRFFAAWYTVHAAVPILRTECMVGVQI